MAMNQSLDSSLQWDAVSALSANPPTSDSGECGTEVHSVRPEKTSIAVEPRHRKIWVTIASVAAVLSLGLAPLVTAGVLSRHVYSNSEVWSCLPNGDVIFPWSNIDLSGAVWTPDSALSITLGFGKLSFSAAKSVDIVWDIFVGRGSQILAAWLTTPLIARTLLRYMEVRPSTFELFTSLNFQPISWKAIYTTAKESATKGMHGSNAGRGRRQLAYIVLAVAYIMFLPTILSAMTGYQTISTAYVARPDTYDLVEAAQLQTVRCIVHDAKRIGLPEPFYAGNGTSAETIFLRYFNMTSNATFQGSQNTTIGLWDGQGFNLSPPPLNIELLNPIASDSFKSNWTARNITFNSSWIEHTASCQPSGYYLWGFSFLLLFSLCILTAIFTAIICAMWTDVYWNSRYDRTSRGWNIYSAVMDLAEAIAAELPEEGHRNDPRRLKSVVESLKGAMAIDVKDLPVSRSEEDQAIKAGQVEERLLPGNRGAIGYLFTTRDVERAKAKMPKWAIVVAEKYLRC